ncbi:MAG: undecaprenyl/decaprenyl-phosphate alpha-N-acetylglucosaminyl 1-phosphate transferase [Bacteroidaceae bacterium]|nr:undecaprenyl/decaprenyl-phosphate alpha-N-acetylglucosaminyl 1-phosphate transferase [Bacteroidaceae bacterium]
MDWTDAPSHRKVHTQPIPRLGGLVFLPTAACSFMLANVCTSIYRQQDPEIHLSTLVMCVSALIIYLVGLVDDIRELHANTKFIIQLVAALVFPMCNLLIGDLQGFLGIHQLPLAISYPLTVFVILLITNAMNLIDGIDGLASGLSILILTCFLIAFFYVHAFTFVLLAASVLGVLIVFFCYNVWGHVGHHKIFMGDSGSLFLGYVIAYLAIKLQMLPGEQLIHGHAPLLFSYTMVIIPTFDVIRVALTRKLNGKEMFCPDKTHIHHRIMDMGFSMRQTLVTILSLFAGFCALNYLLYTKGISMDIIVLTDILLYSSIIVATNQKLKRP